MNRKLLKLKMELRKDKGGGDGGEKEKIYYVFKINFRWKELLMFKEIMDENVRIDER